MGQELVLFGSLNFAPQWVNEKLEMVLLCKFKLCCKGFFGVYVNGYVMWRIFSKSKNSEGEKVCLSIITCSNVNIRNSNVLWEISEKTIFN